MEDCSSISRNSPDRVGYSAFRSTVEALYKAAERNKSRYWAPHGQSRGHPMSIPNRPLIDASFIRKIQIYCLTCFFFKNTYRARQQWADSITWPVSLKFGNLRKLSWIQESWLLFVRKFFVLEDFQGVLNWCLSKNEEAYVVFEITKKKRPPECQEQP